jgi:RimJ/RimL family protein N-acetyltransferase
MDMSKMQTNVIAVGNRIILRDRQPSEVGSYLRWQFQGEWREYDAPWEAVAAPVTEDEEARLRKAFLDACKEEKLTPRKRATIATRDGEPLGWVNRYGKDRCPQAWNVGIDICEDRCLNKGIGTEALGLWIRYLFTHSDVHRIGVDTWSLNPRMKRVAEKLGFTFEGAQREMLEWQGEWLDLHHYGMLRSEWEEMDAESPQPKATS